MLTTKHKEIRFELLEGFRGKLLEDIKYDYYGFSGVIKAGFITDGASIPFFLWKLFDPFQKGTRKASTIHDYLYTEKRKIPRFFCDLIFLRVMKERGFIFWKRHIYFWSVVLCGWYPRNFKPFIKKLIKKYLQIKKTVI